MSEQSENLESGSADQQTPQPAADERASGNATGSSADNFARQVEEAPMGLLAQFWDFIKHEKKWWLTPIILVLLVLAAMMMMGMMDPVAAPFIYPIF